VWKLWLLVLKWPAEEDPFATWTLCNKTLDKFIFGFEYHQVANLPFTPRQKKNQKKKKWEKLHMLNSKSCQMTRLKIRHVALIYRQYIHVTRLSTQQEESILALCCKTLLLNWKCQNGEAREREKRHRHNFTWELN
jgi:hypothetical protein